MSREARLLLAGNLLFGSILLGFALLMPETAFFAVPIGLLSLVMALLIWVDDR